MRNLLIILFGSNHDLGRVGQAVQILAISLLIIGFVATLTWRPINDFIQNTFVCVRGC